MTKREIFLDNAAGSHPKPPQVARAMAAALERTGANPGRGGYTLSRTASALAEHMRGQVAALINAPDASRIVFTAGATMSLNMAIFGLLGGGSCHAPAHVVVGAMEHNALLRPLRYLERRGLVTLSAVQADNWGYSTVADFAAVMRPDTRLIALSHASNVCGSVQPLTEIGQLADARGVPLLVDAAQSAGLLPLDVESQHISLLALAGHKALYGPSGVGALYVAPGLELLPLLSGGTGGQSELYLQPDAYPAHLEAGSLNLPGLAGWSAGLDFVARVGRGQLLCHGLTLVDMLAAQLRTESGFCLHLRPNETRPRVPLLSLTHARLDPEQLADALDEAGIAARSGYQCAPTAHAVLGSGAEGSLRISPAWFNTVRDVEAAARVLFVAIR